ncbi:MAG: response regulator [Deltaproteobacteria bacterium]|nr:response regulator [Deltaproteobacteria bacterium]
MKKTSENLAAKKVLVVDDDDDLRSVLRSALEASGYLVTTVANGKLALHLVSLDKFDCVVSDIRMPEMNGIELLHSIKRGMPGLPVILMTGFSELTETKEAYELGADEFIPKPFRKEELLEAVRTCCFETGVPAPKEPSDEDYSKLSIDDFISGKQIRYDIFIQLTAHKYVKIAHAGQDIPIEQIRKYKGKGIKHLYVRKEDFRDYVGFNLTLMKAVNVSGKVSKAKKLNFMKHTGEMLVEHLYNDRIDKESFDSGKDVVETTVSVLSDSTDIYELLGVLNSHTDFLYAHCLGVSLYSAMIAREMHWVSPANMFKVSVGGLLHDIGKKEIDREILLKARMDLTPEEVKLLESHPVRGFQILSENPSISGDILSIVQQHHETCDGLGYPSGLKKSHIHPLARLVAVANEFCGLAVKGPHSSEGMDPHDAIRRMLSLSPSAYDPEFFMALMRVLKFEVPAGFGKPQKERKAA